LQTLSDPRGFVCNSCDGDEEESKDGEPAPEFADNPASWDSKRVSAHLELVAAPFKPFPVVPAITAALGAQVLDGATLFAPDAMRTVGTALLPRLDKFDVKQLVHALFEPQRNFEKGTFASNHCVCCFCSHCVILRRAAVETHFQFAFKESKSAAPAPGIEAFQRRVFEVVYDRWTKGRLLTDQGKRVVTGVKLPFGASRTHVASILPHAFKCTGQNSLHVLLSPSVCDCVL
jgi:hypothetical protein